MKTPLLYLLWIGVWIVVVALNATILLRWGTGDRYAPVRLMDYFTPWVICIVLPLFFFAIASRSKVLMLSLALPVIYLLIVTIPLFIPKPKACIEAENTLVKVMSYNIWSHNKEIRKITENLAREQPDILLLQEVLPDHYITLQKSLNNITNGPTYESVYDSDTLQVVFSRYPIVSHDILKSQGQALKAVLSVSPNRELTVYNVHPLRRGGWERRHWKIGTLLESISASQGSIILGGDFNTTDRTQMYRMIAGKLKNAHEEGGWGFGFTFPAFGTMRIWGIPLPPLVRIDHIFFKGNLRLCSAGTLKDSGGSDHLPVKALFILE